MNESHKQKIERLFEAALDCDPGKQAAFLEAECRNQPVLLAEVKSLLAARSDARAESFLNQPAFEMQARFFAAEDERENLPEQQTIGNYRIVERIGAGGMGTVYRAVRDDGEYQTEVAVKVIKHGMDTEHILSRFKTERQILANLNHPNVARLFEGGTTADGAPYFVMEYIKGRPLDEYCDERKLSIKERLELFRAVCAAVRYAHQNLVVHRDIKPSNILVTTDGTPKLLDFGIAKILQRDAGAEETAPTATELRVLTPEYASPEQVRGESVNVSSDVYSLGVVLYELLSGRRPYQLKNRRADEIAKIICEQEPEKPSTAINRPGDTGENGVKFETVSERASRTREGSSEKLQRRLRGDLDNIVLTALRKEPARRYSSVEQFAEDIRRHLAGLPVAARGDTWNYRAGKFVSRNRVAVVSAALVVLALVGGIAATAWQAQRAERQRVLAERRLDNLRKMSSSLVEEVHNAIRDLPGSLPARELLATRAVEQLDALAADAGSDDNPVLLADLAMAYQHFSSLPHKSMAERNAVLMKADALYEKVLAQNPRDNVLRGRAAMVLMPLADSARARNDLTAALEYNRRAIEIVETAVRNEPDNPLQKVFLWNVNYNSALTLYQTGEARRAADAMRRLLPIAEELRRIGQIGTEKYNFMRPQLTRSMLAESLSFTGEYEAAAAEFRAVIADCETEIAARPNETILQRNMATAHRRLAVVLQELNDGAAALQSVRAALENFEKLAAANPKDYDYQSFLASAHLVAGQLEARQNHPAKALPHFRRALELNEAIFAADAQRAQAQADAAQARADYGYALVLTGRPDDGLLDLRRALQFYESARAADSIDAHLKRNFAETRAFLAAAILTKNNTPESRAEARELYRQSLELWSDLERRGVLKHSDAAQPIEISRRLAELNRA